MIILLLSFFVSAKTFDFGSVRAGDVNLKVETLWQGRDVIWGVALLPSDDILFTERGGKIRLWDSKARQASEVAGAPSVVERGQGGLLDIALHPEFNKNNRIYLTYSKKVEDGKFTTALATAIFKDKKLSELKDLFMAKPALSATHHFGSRLAFDSRGFLFMTVGDRGERDFAQRLDTHMGKVLRFNDKGEVPADNPFVKQEGALPEIWSYGHRNPQGLAWDAATQTLWEQEHGPRGGDEINIIKRGANYGWPIVTHGREYHGPKIGEGTTKAGVEASAKYFVPSIAPSGLAVYRSNAIAAWKDSIFSGALVLQHLNRLSLKNKEIKTEERFFADKGKRIRDVRVDNRGRIYFSTDDGILARIAR